MTGIHLSKDIIPDIPVRQWILSFPKPLRYLLAYNQPLASKVVSIFINQVLSYIKHQAKKQLKLKSVKQTATGAITFTQRFGGALNLNLHVHTIIPHGVYVKSSKSNKDDKKNSSESSESEKEYQFHEIDYSLNKDLESIQKKITGKIHKLVMKELETLLEEEQQNSKTLDLYQACLKSSALNKIGTGERTGQFVDRTKHENFINQQVQSHEDVEENNSNQNLASQNESAWYESGEVY